MDEFESEIVGETIDEVVGLSFHIAKENTTISFSSFDPTMILEGSASIDQTGPR